MKKIVLLLALVFLSGCDSSLVESGKVTTEEISDTSDKYERTFRSDELGIKFNYVGAAEANVQSSLKDFDTGKSKVVSTPDFSISFTSPDFSMGISEGCCYYYAGEPIGTTMSDGETEVFISRSLGELYNFQRIKVDGREAFRFLRVTEYVEKSIVDTILIPYDHKPYTNIMISGENSGPISGIENISEYAKTFEASSEFENFLESFEFLETENISGETSSKPTRVEHESFTFDWPSQWEILEKSDENTYKFTEGICSAYFSIVAKPEVTYKDSANLFENNNSDLEITVEGGGGVGFNNSKIMYAYGVWRDELMYFVSIANASEDCEDRYDFRKEITKEVVESFLKTFK